MRVLLPGLLLALLALPAASQTPAPSAPPRAAPAAPPVATPATPPRAASQPAPQAAPVAAERVDVNFATAEELDSLPGIGPARAAAIVANRPYRNLDEVASKASIPASVLAPIRARLTATQINVNAATKREMTDILPGIGDARADAIIRNRPYANLTEVVTKAGVPQAVFDHIRAALTLR
ncbi:ComEA family DNA-binding protein [Muricoccus radiodurans]|uniref:ComEA family DNA-binding protein n=1 Tax=Muricoccus radiodurans TaxID=2231721 RepID=UPI003CEA7ACF